MLQQSFILHPDVDYPLHLTSKRYWVPSFDAHKHDQDTLTLIFLHSTSFHKEAWEPTIETLFSLVEGRNSHVKIREAWAIDCPNHGAAVELNEVALRLPEYFDNFTCEKYALAVHRFLNVGPTKDAQVDFRSRKLVGLGHSLGSVAMTILQHIGPIIEFETLILAEPMLSPKGPEFLLQLRTLLVKGAYERRDVWPSREDAFKNLKNRPRTRSWHPRILELFVKHALRTHPGARHSDTPYNGVTLCCTRDQEAAMYRDVDGPTKPVIDLNKACARIPIHVVFGDNNDYLPRAVHDAVTDPDAPRKFASITRIKNCGHLIPQQAPEALAEVVVNILGPHVHAKARDSRVKL